MNQLWVRISLTYVAIAIFLFLVPTVIFLAVQADSISADGDIVQSQPIDFDHPGFLVAAYHNLVGADRLEIVSRFVRILLATSLVGILVGTISSIGLTAPLHNLAVAARAVGSQDLSQRIKVRGSSEVREVAEAFNAMAEALQEAEKLRSNMLTDITHELRTPLTVIQGNLRAILDDVYELDKVEVARLYDQTRQLSRLVDDLHDLALLEADRFSLSLAQQNLADIVQRVAAIYRPIFEDQGVSLSLDLANNLPPLVGDSARITQCLNNLLNNALRHTPSGGEVTISLAQDSGRLKLSVADNGAGIEAVHLPHVFDRFYRVDSDRNRQTGGSGLGLAITQALVKAHGGEILAASPGKDQGSEFTIYFPSAS
ncbi:MAG: sensor histidine kinase [Anaerolineales bacterium]